MQNAYSRTQNSAQAMQVQHQDKIIRSASRRRDGNDKRDMIRNSRNMVQEAMSVKKTVVENSPPKNKDRMVEVALDEHVFLVRSKEDTRRNPVSAPPKRAPRQAQTPTKQAPTKVQAQPKTIVAKPQRQYFVFGEDFLQSAEVFQNTDKTPQNRKAEVLARRKSAVEKKDQPRVVRAHGISSTPSADSRRARLLEQKLRAMSSRKI